MWETAVTLSQKAIDIFMYMSKVFTDFFFIPIKDSFISNIPIIGDITNFVLNVLGIGEITVFDWIFTTSIVTFLVITLTNFIVKLWKW